MNCPHCRSEQVVKAGRRKLKAGPVRQLYRCNGYQLQLTLYAEALSRRTKVPLDGSVPIIVET